MSTVSSKSKSDISDSDAKVNHCADIVNVASLALSSSSSASLPQLPVLASPQFVAATAAPVANCAKRASNKQEQLDSFSPARNINNNNNNDTNFESPATNTNHTSGHKCNSSLGNSSNITESNTKREREDHRNHQQTAPTASSQRRHNPHQRQEQPVSSPPSPPSPLPLPTLTPTHQPTLDMAKNNDDRMCEQFEDSLNINKTNRQKSAPAPSIPTPTMDNHLKHQRQAKQQSAATTNNNQVSTNVSSCQAQHQPHQRQAAQICIASAKNSPNDHPISKTSAPLLSNQTRNNTSTIPSSASTIANSNGASPIAADKQTDMIQQQPPPIKNTSDSNESASGDAVAVVSNNNIDDNVVVVAALNSSSKIKAQSIKFDSSNNGRANNKSYVQDQKTAENVAAVAQFTPNQSSRVGNQNGGSRTNNQPSITFTSSVTSSNTHNSSSTDSSSSSNNSKQPTTTISSSGEQKSQHNQHDQQQQPASSADSQKVPCPATPNNRSVLILREIESETPEKLVKDIFYSENCPSEPVHCEYAHNNSWYVTFKNDEDAKHALAFIRKYAIEWNNKPIMARIKPKPATIPVISNRNISALIVPTSSNDLASAEGTALLRTNSSIATPMINPVTAATSGGVLMHQPAPGSIMHVGPHMMSHHHPSPAPSGSQYNYTAMSYYGQPAATMVPTCYAGSQRYVDLRDYFKNNGLIPDQAALKQNHNLVISPAPIKGGSDYSGSNHASDLSSTPPAMIYGNGIQQDGLNSLRRGASNNNNNNNSNISNATGADIASANNGSHRNNSGNHQHHHAHHRNNNRYNSASNNSHANSNVSSSSNGIDHPRQRPQVHSITGGSKQRENASGNIASN